MPLITRMFYSYSHQDTSHKTDMERALKQLREDRLLSEWSDIRITPGTTISTSIRQAMDRADVFAFLVSQNFIASDVCRQEWEWARELESRRHVLLIPIIVADCAWKDFDTMRDYKALPNDARPVVKFRPRSAAWQEVYEGIKAAIEDLRRNFEPKTAFVTELQRTGFLSHDHIRLDDIFVFPVLSTYVETGGENTETIIETLGDLLESEKILVLGDELSGKTTLCRHIFLDLVKRGKPVLYIDANAEGVEPSKAFETAYEREFHGDYSLWKEQKDRTIIVDNLTKLRKAISLLADAVEAFDNVIVTTTTQIHDAYFRDDDRLAHFTEVELLPMTHRLQEKLIRRRVTLSGRAEIGDGGIDEIENRVNDVVVNGRVVPRYPFYILSILQAYEGFMPDDLSITSYGHCYYVLILAHLFKSGISKSDEEINMCLNFCEHLAAEIYRVRDVEDGHLGGFVQGFVETYKKKFLINTSTLNRLLDDDFGVVGRDGRFKSAYMYYFFLGRFLSHGGPIQRDILNNLLENSAVTHNARALMFAIHIHMMMRSLRRF